MQGNVRTEELLPLLVAVLPELLLSLVSRYLFTLSLSSAGHC